MPNGVYSTERECQADGCHFKTWSRNEFWEHHFSKHGTERGEMSTNSKRFVVLGGPGGHLTCQPMDSPMIQDRYKRWQPLFSVNRPLSTDLANAAKSAVFRCFEIR